MAKFSAFFDANYARVLGVAERRLNCRHDAEEIASEAFRIAWIRHASGQELSVPWLYVVVRNLVGVEYRRRTRRTALQSRMEETEAAAPGATSGIYADIRDALERLSEPHREILQMIYWDGLTGSEAAIVLQVSETAARTRLMRARRALRAELELEVEPGPAPLKPAVANG